MCNSDSLVNYSIEAKDHGIRLLRAMIDIDVGCIFIAVKGIPHYKPSNAFLCFLCFLAGLFDVAYSLIRELRRSRTSNSTNSTLGGQG